MSSSERGCPIRGRQQTLSEVFKKPACHVIRFDGVQRGTRVYNRSRSRQNRAVVLPGPTPPAHLLPRRKIDFYHEDWLCANCLSNPTPTGCSIQHIVNAHHTSWRASYPGKPGSKTRHYGLGIDTMEQACDFVLAWLWKRHQAIHPYDHCPWDFGSVDA